MDLLALIHVHICISCCLTAHAFTHHGLQYMTGHKNVQPKFCSVEFFGQSVFCAVRSQLLYVTGQNFVLPGFVNAVFA
jgi:hypothetical protein